MGIRPIKKGQEDANEMFFGYKLRLIADAGSEMPPGFSIAPADMHDKWGSEDS